MSSSVPLPGLLFQPPHKCWWNRWFSLEKTNEQDFKIQHADLLPAASCQVGATGAEVVGHAVLTHGADRQDQELASGEVGELQQVPDLNHPLANKVSGGPEHGPPGVEVEPGAKVYFHLERPIWVEGEDVGLDPVHQQSIAIASLHDEPVASRVAGPLNNNDKVSVRFTKSRTDFCLILFSYLLRDLDSISSYLAVHNILGEYKRSV